LGQIYERGELRGLKLSDINMPIIFCNATSSDIKKLKEIGYTLFELNTFLAERLTAIDQEDRHVKAESIARELLADNSTPLILQRFEMLFDPRYKIDPIKLFELTAKQVSLAVIWPGSIKGQTLTYADPGHTDYHQYNVSEYNVFCCE